MGEEGATLGPGGSLHHMGGGGGVLMGEQGATLGPGG